MNEKHDSGTKALGQWLIEQDALREEQVAQILELQQRNAAAGVRCKFGELCVRSGWASASEVNLALRNQQKRVIDHTGLGDMMIALNYVTREQLGSALESHIDMFEPLDEIVVDRGLCTHEQVRVASQLLALRRNGAARLELRSTFVPINVMALLVTEQIDEVLRRAGQCQCTQCWSNIFAVALNELPPRYLSEHTRLLDYLPRFRKEYEELVCAKLVDAVKRVHDSPKAACRSRISEDLLTEGEFEGEVYEVVVHVSNHHVHLSQEDVENLFGTGYSLTKLKDLMQPGQYAATEIVSLIGPKGRLDHVRVLGPPRRQTQVEISGTDQFILGIHAPVRESGLLEGSAGISLRGPAGQRDLEYGAIRALRHIHMLPQDTDRMGLQNGDSVSLRLVGDRPTICEGVLVRATATSALEVHIDTDEANGAGLPAESQGQILVPAMAV